MFKQMLPLYEKHDFWDTQPVPKSGMTDSIVSSEQYKISICVCFRQ